MVKDIISGILLTVFGMIVPSVPPAMVEDVSSSIDPMDGWLIG